MWRSCLGLKFPGPGMPRPPAPGPRDRASNPEAPNPGAPSPRAPNPKAPAPGPFRQPGGRGPRSEPALRASAPPRPLGEEEHAGDEADAASPDGAPAAVVYGPVAIPMDSKYGPGGWRVSYRKGYKSKEEKEKARIFYLQLKSDFEKSVYPFPNMVFDHIFPKHFKMFP